MGSCRTFCRTDGERGQSTVEAAALLPVIMLLFALLLQPVCAFYTLAVMRHAAAEAARVMATGGDETVATGFALRRLSAVPEASLFHVGGTDDWQVSASSQNQGDAVTVEVAGHVRPLPLFGVAMGWMGRRDGRDILLRTSLTSRVRPAWLKGGYEDWTTMWQEGG